MSRSALAKDFWFTLYGLRGNEQLEQELEHFDEISINERHQGEQIQRPSLYVKVFEDMIHVVVPKEGHLLTDEELDVLRIYSALDYRARYLLVRLVFRQPEWHALSSLGKYASELGEEGLRLALNELTAPLKADTRSESTPRTPLVKKEEEIADLTFLNDDKQDDKIKALQAPSSQLPSTPLLVKPGINPFQVLEEPLVDPRQLKFDYLFRDQDSMSVEEALSRLTLPDLREIMRSMKVRSPLTRKDAIIKAMITHAAGQHTLPSMAKGKGKSKKAPQWDGIIQTQLSFGQRPKVTSQLNRLREMALERLGPCVKINPNLHWLVGRLHIICYRGTEKPTKYCLPALLAGFKKWNFPEYECERDPRIWATREDLLEYEEALYLDAEMDCPPELTSNSPSTTTDQRFKTPATPAKHPTIHLQTPKSISTPGSSSVTSTVKDKERPGLPLDDNLAPPEEGKESVAIQRAKHVRALYNERIEPKWRNLLRKKDQEKGKTVERTPGLERFEAGYVYTRMVAKAVNAFGIVKEYDTELGIIEELLQQTHWCKGKRARWYERRALIQERYIEPRNLEVVKNSILQALADEYTGIVHRPGLVRRLQRIEKKMKLHPEKRTLLEVVLKDPETITIQAKRTDLRPGVKLDQSLRPVIGEQNTPLRVFDFFSSKPIEKQPEKDPEKEADVALSSTMTVQLTAPETVKKTGKSSWVGLGDEAVNVETFALQYYEMNGYIGFHSETRILTTIFALLFWDVIFSPVPGAFETAFQAGPLDMLEDSFYLARQQLFEARLAEIKEGKAREYLLKHDEMFRPKRTWCIGLRWDMCEQKQLLEIVECLGGDTLAMICQLFCEDYAGRSSGVPDLIIWKMEERICKFVEVKGPGDQPQPNQRLWFDSLIRAGAHVEICKVMDQDAPERPKRKRKTAMKSTKENVASDEEDAGEQGMSDDDDNADYLPQAPSAKRRKVVFDERESAVLSPTSTVNTLATPSSMASRSVNEATVVVIPTPTKKKPISSVTVRA